MHTKTLTSSDTTETRIVLASNNAGKIHEFNQLLQHLPIQVIRQAELSVNEIEETGLSFVENAILKARNAALQTGLPAIADDSGIIVDALQGLPGIYSARFAGHNSSDAQNLAKLLDMIQPIAASQLTAKFISVMIYLRTAQDPMPIIATGTWDGLLVKKPIGANGFGYDPIFYVPSHKCTAAELLPEIKNTISHRSQACKKLLHKLESLYIPKNREKK